MDSPIMMMVLKFLNSLIMFEFHVLLIEEFEIKVYFIYHCVSTQKNNANLKAIKYVYPTRNRHNMQVQKEQT